jgi:hypothetical protein
LSNAATDILLTRMLTRAIYNAAVVGHQMPR